MIVYVSGGLFTSPAGTLVNTVNTAGVMGKGIAKAFKACYPDMFAAYAARCEAGDLVPGSLFLWRSPHKQVLSLPTKRHWRSPSRLEDVEAALRTFADNCMGYGLTSVAFPQLGCGNGGLDWEREVRPLMERWLLPLPIVSYIHVSDGTLPDKAETKEIAAWLAGEPVLLAFAPFADDLRAAGPAIDDEAARRLWVALDATGLVLREDVPSWLDADATLEALAGLPYLQRARAHVVAITSPDAYDAGSTADLLAGRAADAVRLLAMRVPASHRPRAVTVTMSALDQDGTPWAPLPASPTPTQSELSLTG